MENTFRGSADIEQFMANQLAKKFFCLLLISACIITGTIADAASIIVNNPGALHFGRNDPAVTVRLPNPLTGFSNVSATASNSNATPRSVSNSVPGAKPYFTTTGTGSNQVANPAGPYATPLLTRTGQRYVANAKAQANVRNVLQTSTPSGAGVSGVTYDTAGSVAQIGFVASSPIPRPRENALAIYRVADPLFLAVEENDILTIALTFDPGTLIEFVLDEPDEHGRAALHIDKGTNISGFEELMAFDLLVEGGFGATPSIDFSFHSNPLLGLDDSVIEAAFESLLFFDQTTGILSLTSSINLFEASIPIPSGVMEAAIATNEFGLAEVRVPEPATITLFGLGFVCFGFFGSKNAV